MIPRRRILVTGAASGLGRATCERLGRAGASVGGLDTNATELRSVIDEMSDTGLTAVAGVADVTDLAAVESVVNTIADQLGGLDAVVNAAGIGGYTGDVVRTSPLQWSDVLAVNLTGVFHVSRSAIPYLRASGGGAIVNVSSQYGLVGCAESPAYCASKAGVIGLTRAMAVDHATDGITVSCLCPGPIDTPLLARSLAQEAGGKLEPARTRGRLLGGRPGSPDDVAEAIQFMLTAGFVTGSIVSLDGGWTAS